MALFVLELSGGCFSRATPLKRKHTGLSYLSGREFLSEWVCQFTPFMCQEMKCVAKHAMWQFFFKCCAAVTEEGMHGITSYILIYYDIQESNKVNISPQTNLNILIFSIFCKTIPRSVPLFPSYIQ